VSQVQYVYHYWRRWINHSKTKRRLLYLKTQFVSRSKHLHLGYKNLLVYAVSGTSRCLFSDKYKTHKYSVDRKYNSWMLNLLSPTYSVQVVKQWRDAASIGITKISEKLNASIYRFQVLNMKTESPKRR